MAETGIHHVMVRGVNRDAIYLEDTDYRKFLASLGQAKDASGCGVLAYCLMPNHAHLLLRVGDEPIGHTMKRVGVSYVGWFNRTYGRVGHLFQDRFASRPVEDDSYFMTVIRYVWNNPVRAGMVREPMEYRWNSCAPLQPTGLVDTSLVDDLLPSLARSDLSAAPTEPAPIKRPLGPRPLHSADEVASLLAMLSGARTAEEFARLDPLVQRRAIGQLRGRSIAYSAIARATGLTKVQVQRAYARRLNLVESDQ